jgi:lipid-A-disaccharide synthase
MAAAGLERVADQEALAVGGLLEWIPSLGRIAGLWRRVIRGLRATRPSLVVVVDSGGFHLPFMRVARFFCDAPILYYVAPQVWVWRAGRVRRIAARADRIAVVWPFEPDFWAERGVATDFVGHPILDRQVAQPPSADAHRDARAALGLEPERPLVGLFPGSRRNELLRHLPPMVAALAVLREARPELDAVIVRAPSVDPDRLDRLLAEAGAGSAVRVVPAAPAWLDALDVGLSKPGTITLELLLRERPMVVVGRAHPLSVALVGRSFAGTRVALPNWIAGDDIVPELLQEDATADRIAAESPGASRRARGLGSCRPDRGGHAWARSRIAWLCSPPRVSRLRSRSRGSSARGSAPISENASGACPPISRRPSARRRRRSTCTRRASARRRRRCA